MKKNVLLVSCVFAAVVDCGYGLLDENENEDGVSLIPIQSMQEQPRTDNFTVSQKILDSTIDAILQKNETQVDIIVGKESLEDNIVNKDVEKECSIATDDSYLKNKEESVKTEDSDTKDIYDKVEETSKKYDEIVEDNISTEEPVKNIAEGCAKKEEMEDEKDSDLENKEKSLKIEEVAKESAPVGVEETVMKNNEIVENNISTEEPVAKTEETLQLMESLIESDEESEKNVETAETGTSENIFQRIKNSSWYSAVRSLL